jgi:hypothetical protein
MPRLRLLLGALATAAVMANGGPAHAADLKPATILAFERYQRAAEADMARDLAAPDRFLRALPTEAAARQRLIGELRRGEVLVERLAATEDGRRIRIPDGLGHHWIGAIYVAGARLDQAIALMQAYDRHAQFFRPYVVRSETLEHDGDRFRVFLRFFFKKVISVTVNTESTAVFTRYDATRASSAIRSTRIAEVENAAAPTERELPVGHDGGYLWRLNSYWRFLERDGGTFVECESLTLTRGVPTGLGWVIGPFVTSIPRDTLTLTLQATKKALLAEPHN